MADFFRKEAMENFTAKDGLNRGIHAVSIRMRLGAVGLALCAAVFTVWLVFGTILETMPLYGVVWQSKTGGTLYAEADGLVTKLAVETGMYVRAGDIIAIVPQKYWLDEIAKTKAAGATPEQTAYLYAEYDRYSLLRSTVSGLVTQLTAENTYVARGDKIATVIPYDKNANNNRVIAFIPAKHSALLDTGMAVQITPEFAPREVYGYIDACISSIGTYPVTGRFVKENSAELYNETMNEDESYIQIEITMIADFESAGGLKWSNPKSGNIDAPMGTVCGGDIVIKKCRPFEWLFQGGRTL